MSTRTVVSATRSQATIEGAGVQLRRAFGFDADNTFDPFLLLDDFRSDVPAHYQAGFPWHPHRGIETITYVLAGEVEHADSLGNRGVIGAGDVQWMTAGSGIIHQEMPRGDEAGRMYGFQLWANLPAQQKMKEPRYRDVKASEIPVVRRPGGVEIRVVAGSLDGQRGPVADVAIAPEYLDVSLPAGQTFVHPLHPERTVFAYVFAGSGRFGPEPQTGPVHGDHTLLRFGAGDQVRATASAQEALRLLLVAGRPLGEPVAWRGPIVMNTQAELAQAFAAYRAGTFLRHAR